MMAFWAKYFPANMVIPKAWEYEDSAPDIQIVVDRDRLPLTYSAQYTGITRTGRRTIDTFLDQVVFGIPITGFDLWQKAHLHESSRRTNLQCGIDVIVASATSHTAHKGGGARPMCTAAEAAQTLLELAREHFPDSALATCDVWARTYQSIRDTKAANVIAELQNRGLRTTKNSVKDVLQPYV